MNKIPIDIWRQAGHGQKDAQWMLFHHTADELLGIAFRYAGNLELAEIWMEEGYVNLFTRMHTCPLNESPEIWMRREMAMACAKQSLIEYSISQEIQSHSISENPARSFRASGLDAQQIFNMLVSLPPYFRTIINLYSVDGFSFVDISKALRMQESEVVLAYSKARLMMAAIMSTNIPQQHE